MKKFAIPLIAAILGSTFTIGTVMYFDIGNAKTVKVEHLNTTPSMGAVYTVSEDGEYIPLEFTNVAENVMPAVVHIKSTQTYVNRSGNYHRSPMEEFFNDDFFEHFFGPGLPQNSPRNQKPQVRVGAGSGVIISEDGYIVTNNHVIAQADDIEVALNDNRTYKAVVVGTDPSTDLALLQIKEKDLPYLPITNSDNVKVGEWVLAVGNPFNLNSTVTAGIVSAKGRNINILKDRSAIESFIQTDAAINPGNSGGALVDLRGGLVGINTAIASPTGAYAGYGFAVPSNIVSKVVNDLMEYGIVQRGFLGVWIRNVDGNLAKEKELGVTTGVLVDSLMTNSAAKNSGIKPGDVILKVDGTEVSKSSELQEAIARHRPGDKVDILVDRKGKTKTFEVVLNNRDGNIEMVQKENKEILNMLGATFEEVDAKTAKKIGIPGGIKVVELNNGKLRKETNIQQGFIITKIDNKAVTTLDEFTEILKNKEGGVMLEGIYSEIPGKYYYAFGM